MHDNYVYQDSWAELIISRINAGTLTKDIWKAKFKAMESFN